MEIKKQRLITNLKVYEEMQKACVVGASAFIIGSVVEQKFAIGTAASIISLALINRKIRLTRQNLSDVDYEIVKEKVIKRGFK